MTEQKYLPARMNLCKKHKDSTRQMSIINYRTAYYLCDIDTCGMQAEFRATVFVMVK